MLWCPFTVWCFTPSCWFSISRKRRLFTSFPDYWCCYRYYCCDGDGNVCVLYHNLVLVVMLYLSASSSIPLVLLSSSSSLSLLSFTDGHLVRRIFAIFRMMDATEDPWDILQYVLCGTHLSSPYFFQDQTWFPDGYHIWSWKKCQIKCVLCNRIL